MFNIRKSKSDSASGDDNPAPESLPQGDAPAPAKPPLAASILDNNRPAIISQRFLVVGEIRSDGILHVEGRAQGSVTAGVIHVGSEGQIEGDVQCDSLHIKGRFSGIAHCRELVIASSAQIQGRISYAQITIGRGARVDCDLTLSA